MIEILCIITNSKNDKKIKRIENKYHLPFNLATYGSGTASSSLLNYFGLEQIKKYIYFSLINYNKKENIFNDINNNLKLDKHGNGIAFTIPISSSTKHIKDKIMNNSKEQIKIDNEKNKSNNHELIITVVNEGFAYTVMNTAKNKGANGGTLLKGRSLLENSSKNQFLGITIEPEKDIVIIATEKEKKHEIMASITDTVGLKTKGNGIVFSLPIEDAIGLYK